MTTESRVQLSPENRAELEGWVAGRNTPQKLVWRARIVLMWADGAGITKIVQATGETKRIRSSCAFCAPLTPKPLNPLIVTTR